MQTPNVKTTLTFILSALLAFPIMVQADLRRDNDSRQEHRIDDRRDDRQDDRADDRRFDRRDDRRDDRRYERRGNNNLLVIAPRHRAFNNVIVVRNYGHSYLGYGHHLHDNDAWK